MKTNGKLRRLKSLQAEIDAIRLELNISQQNEVVYLAPLDDCDDEVIVIADGFGAATTSIIEGNYPIDFFTRYEKQFVTETAAVRAAEKIVDRDEAAAEVLG